MTRRKLAAAGPSAAPPEAPIPWSEHPFSASGGDILAMRILPLMGPNARNYAWAAAVCHDWHSASRAAAATVNVYRETSLPAIQDNEDVTLEWSPSGKYFAAAMRYPPRISIWRASTGALVSEWALATPETAVPEDILENANLINVAFSRDSTRVLTLFVGSNHFAIWSVPDGQLIAVNHGDDDPDEGVPDEGTVTYARAAFGVPGSASDGLVGLLASDGLAIDFWDILPPPEGGDILPRLRSHLPLDVEAQPDSFSISPDGSKVAATCCGTARVFDVASLAQLGSYRPHRDDWDPDLTDWVSATWTTDSQKLVFSWGDVYACVWDFRRPEEPAFITIDAGPNACLLKSPFLANPDHRFPCLSCNGASYFVVRIARGPRTRKGKYYGQTTYALEERSLADGSVVRAINNVRSTCRLEEFPAAVCSPDSLALLMYPSGDVPARVVVFD